MSRIRDEHLARKFKDKKVLLGVTGSIAAFKAVDLVREFKNLGAQVRVILTENAARFVAPLTLETLSGNPVLTSMWGTGFGQGTYHIDVARWADYLVIAPATANALSRMVQGEASELLYTEYLAFQGPVWIAPAMNPAMYAHPAVQANMATLRSRGALLVGPTEGDTACGELGVGRMIEPEFLIAQMALDLGRTATSPSPGRVLITVGPTQSHLDGVRFLTNRSSGKMGAHLAWAAALRGYSVSVVCGPVDSSIDFPPGAEVVRVRKTHEMRQEVLKRWPLCQGFIGAAAVLDWDFENEFSNKIKKETGAPSLQLKASPDILSEVGRTKSRGQWVLGFAAETENWVANGKKKMFDKGCDFLFVNDVSSAQQGFESDFNSGIWLEGNVERKSPIQSKANLSEWIWNQLKRESEILVESHPLH